ncbi:MAG: class I SAM-dependent RNA methyltransferase [Rhodobacteraceae bacterium]|nr:class I SAM-dependent RNA methyltransferase [Paracoccaceae bacterium]
MRLTIERLGHLGDGIAEGPVFVPLTLPGEVVEGDVEGGRIEAPKIVTPSPDRVAPPCRHFRACGGCSLMHGSDGFVADWKAEVVRIALAAQGIEAAFRPVMTSHARSRRRATLAGRRTKKGAIVGFHGRASGTIVEIPDCRLLHPDVVAMLPVLEEVTVIGASRKGEVDLALTLGDAGLDLAVSGAKPLEQSLFQEIAALADRADLARVSWNGEVVATRRPPAQVFARARVVPPPGAFLQATAGGEAALVDAMREIAGEARRVADLFAGCGTFALPLAERAEVHAVEGEGSMTAALEQGWRRAEGLKRVTVETRDLFRRPLLADEFKGTECIVIDPPRSGAEAQSREIAASRAGLVGAVSCNPVTFARDARILADAGFVLDWVQVVDQFRWSPHVELAAKFSR